MFRGSRDAPPRLFVRRIPHPSSHRRPPSSAVAPRCPRRILRRSWRAASSRFDRVVLRVIIASRRVHRRTSRLAAYLTRRRIAVLHRLPLLRTGFTQEKGRRLAASRLAFCRHFNTSRGAWSYCSTNQPELTNVSCVRTGSPLVSFDKKRWCPVPLSCFMKFIRSQVNMNQCKRPRTSLL